MVIRFGKIYLLHFDQLVMSEPNFSVKTINDALKGQEKLASYVARLQRRTVRKNKVDDDLDEHENVFKKPKFVNLIPKSLDPDKPCRPKKSFYTTISLSQNELFKDLVKNFSEISVEKYFSVSFINGEIAKYSENFSLLHIRYRPVRWFVAEIVTSDSNSKDISEASDGRINLQTGKILE